MKKLLNIEQLPKYRLPIYDNDVEKDGSIKKKTVKKFLKIGLINKDKAKEMLKPTVEEVMSNPIIKTENVKLKGVKYRAYCECGGELIKDNGNIQYQSYPPQYKHKCNKCNKKQLISAKNYPFVDIVEDE